MPLQSSPVKFSDFALKEIKEILHRKNVPEGYGLRIGVRGGGCAKPSLFIGFDQPKDQDDIYEEHGFQLLIDKKHLMHLLGVQVDFVDSDTERGFLLTYPD